METDKDPRKKAAEGTIYLFSGIGCSPAVFERLVFPPGYTVKPIRWMEPERGEDFSHYCARMIRGIDFSPSDILCGVSLGGMAVQEVARQQPWVRRVVVISSAVDVSEYAAGIRLFRTLGFWRLTPGRAFLSRRLRAWLVTGHMRKREIAAVERFFEPLSGRYFRFALRVCMTFPAADGKLLSRIRRIHGHRDELFPVKRLVSPVEDIEKGTHLAVYARSREVSKAFAKVIADPWCPSV